MSNHCFTRICNRKSYSIFVALLGCLLIQGGCGLYDPTPPDSEEEPQSTSSSAEEEQLPLTIGDVESQVYMTADIAEDAQGSNVEIDTLRSRNERVQLKTVTITPPFPDSLICSFHLASEQNFPDNPVAILGRVLRDDEEIGEFEAVLGAKAVRRRMLDDDKDLPSLEYHFDVLEGLEEVPETMLVLAEMDAKLTPTGTEEEGLDPATVTVREANHGILRSNPLRINFTQDTAEE